MYDITKIKEYKTFDKVTQIKKGWSNDIKYHVITKINDSWVVRISDFNHFDNKKQEYNIIKQMYSLGIKTHEPILFDEASDKSFVYYIVKYLHGDQAELLLNNYSEIEQYKFGLKMGKVLKQIHSNDVIKDSNWNDLYKKKINKRIKKYKELNMKSKIVEEMIGFVKDHIYLLKKRPTCLHHGDYHVGNMIISPTNDISIIDWNRQEHGDPYYEFNRIFFSFKISPYFAKGQIEGYFNNNIPPDFFLYMKFYILSVMIGNLPWAIKFNIEDVIFAKESNKRIYEEYNQFKDTIPNWYKDLIKDK